MKVEKCKFKEYVSVNSDTGEEFDINNIECDKKDTRKIEVGNLKCHNLKF